MNIHEVIREHRERMNVTQKDMAKKLYIGHNTYSQYETGKRGIEAETLFKIANILKINLLSYQSEELQGDIKSDTNFDFLTKIHNRRYFLDKMDGFVDKKKPFAFCLIDLDNFKSYNDTEGHDRGDEVLKTLGLLLKGTSFESGRLGGEEFGLLIPFKDDDIPSFLMEIKKDFIHQCPELTFSIGLSYFPKDAKSSEELYLKSDKALYTAKANGKNSIVEY